jgi:mannose-6-phosphate isomerase-like protein (cupin superfamily)
MTALAQQPQRRTLDPAHAFDVTGAIARLCAADGGYEIVHESTRLQIYVYTLVAPEPDQQRMNADDELYIVLEGSGMLDVDGEHLELWEGRAVFVPAGADHCFSAYEHLTVLGILERERNDVRTGVATSASQVRPQPAGVRASPSEEQPVEGFPRARTGRPSRLEVRRQNRLFVSVLARADSVEEAWQQSGMSADRALRMLDDPAVRAVWLAAKAVTV